jgi:hypothetical protein
MEPTIDAPDVRHDRSSFLKKLGVTLAVGLGISAATSETALAACDGIICYPGPCNPGDYCQGVLCSGNCFHCVGCSDDFYLCSQHSCTTWCYVSVC